MQQYSNYLIGATQQAVRELVDLTRTKNMSIRRLACKDVIEFSLRAVEILEVKTRLDEIEREIFKDDREKRHRK
jgi:hypothetical protein